MPATSIPPRALLVGVVVAVAVGTALQVTGLPSPALFAGLAGGAAATWRLPQAPVLPRAMVTLAQGVVGVSIGEAVTVPALRQIVADWPSVVAVVVVTLLLSLLSGLALARLTPVSLATGVFSMVAGGASGITTVADELGADARVVSVLQYLRVLLVLATLPVVVGIVFHGGGTSATASASAGPAATGSVWTGLVLVTVSVAVGAGLARLVPVSTLAMLGPLAVAAGLALWGGLGPARTPEPLVAAAMGVIGLQVGVKFTRASMVEVARLLPAALALIVSVLGACGLMGWLLSLATGVDPLTTYLATTPGGLFAALATARVGGAEPTYVFAVQLARLLAILALAPLLARTLRDLTPSGACPRRGRPPRR